MYRNLSRGELLPLLKNYKVVRTVLDYLTIYEFKRDRPPPGNWLLLILLMTTSVMII